MQGIKPASASKGFKMAIRYDKQLNSEIQRIVSSFNRKVKRLESQDKKLIPEKTITTRELKDQFSKRSDLRIRLREMQEFVKRGSEEIVRLDGSNITKYELKIAKRRKTRLLRQINKDIEEQEQRVDITKPATQATLSRLQSIKKSISRKVSSRDIVKAINREYLRKYDETRIETFYENWFKALWQEAGFVEIDDEQKKMLEEKLRQLTPDQLLRAEKENGAIASIFDYYQQDLGYTMVDEFTIKNMFKYLIDNVDDIVKQYKD